MKRVSSITIKNHDSSQFTFGPGDTHEANSIGGITYIPHDPIAAETIWRAGRCQCADCKSGIIDRPGGPIMWYGDTITAYGINGRLAEVQP